MQKQPGDWRTGNVIISGLYGKYVRAPGRVHGIKLARMKPGDNVVIIGTGLIDLMLT